MASNPTWDECWTQTKATINQLQKLDLFCNTSSPNWLDLEDTLKQSLEGEYIDKVLERAKKDRLALSGILSPANVQARLEPHWMDLARAAGIASRDLRIITLRLREYMIANNYAVKERNLTFGTITAAAGNVGGGTINRLTVDADGQEIEAIFTELKTAVIVADQGQVNKHEEVFEVRGAEAETDFAQVLGSGMLVNLSCLSVSQDIIGNPSFEAFTGTAPTAGVPTTLTSTTQLTNWVVTTAASAAVQLDTVYRSNPLTTLSYALTFTGNNKIDQVIDDNTRYRFDPSVPIYIQIAVYRVSNCDGTLTLRFGASSVAVDMTTLNNAAWNIVRLTVGTANWYDNFYENAMDVEVELASRTTGSLHLDDFIARSFTNLDGTWYAAVGNPTPFARGDTFTWTDSEATRGIIQHWIWRGGLGYLRSHAHATQITASGGRTLTFANSGSSDTITASTGSFVTDGYKVGMLVTIAGSSSNNMTTGPIVTVTATVLTFGSGTSLTNEGPVSATTTLDATPSITEPV